MKKKGSQKQSNLSSSSHDVIEIVNAVLSKDKVEGLRNHGQEGFSHSSQQLLDKAIQSGKDPPSQVIVVNQNSTAFEG